LATGCVTTVKLADGSVTSIKIADEAVITSKLADGSVTSAKIVDGNITAIDLADYSIITAKIADGAVTTTKIADGAVVTAKLADGSVTSAKILDGTVAAADLATGAVNTFKIADGAVTTVKIADYAVTNLKLASYAIPFNSTYSVTLASTTETANWVDMAGMSLTIRLDRISHVIILFSTVAYNSDPACQIWVRAQIGATTAYPGEIMLTPTISEELGWPANHRHTIYYMAYSFHFYRPLVTAGTYTVRIQWRVTGGTGYAVSRTLTVIALPT
jgi:molybdopterin-binding protein